MQIKELFTKPIDRPIVGVIKADQSDADSVWQELEEYVVTKELDEHLRKFFDAYLQTIDNPKDPAISGRIGVWVSGFFGSGKSHFIKILSYLLENREVTKDGVTKRAIEFFADKIQDPMLAGDIKRAVNSDVDVILFNIDSKADSTDGRDAILRVFLKVFNEKLGFSGDHPHIAHMERYLAGKGKLDAFRAAYEVSSGESWESERDAYQFHTDTVAKALTKALGKDIKDADNWLERFEGDFSLSVENLAKWVREYLDDKGPKHRIVFLADEIGQFIGQDTHLMLNLQTIAEDLGTACAGRAWVVVTSQEDIDAVLGEVRASKANDFSKIQGRFQLRRSLSSANVDEVIQKRLLAKTDAAKSELAATYKAKVDILKNQLSFNNVGMTLRPYADDMDFVNVYPFAPYQFVLVQKIFETVRKAGATGIHLARGERSMLDAFQTAAISVSTEQADILVPLHRFYPAIESFLEGVVKSTIDNAASDASLEPFDGLVLRTLFLIRYVDEIKGNVDNLVTLFIDCIDANRLALRNEIEASLQRLEKVTLISRSGEDYFFLTNEERDISREIKAVDLNSAEEAKLLGEIIFDDVLGSLRKYRYPLNNKDFGVNRLCDLHPYGTRTDGDLVVSVVTPLCDDYEMFGDAKCITQSTEDHGQVLIKLDNEKSLGRELRTYLQTEKYIAHKSDGSAPSTTMTILRERAHENRQRRERLKAFVDRLLREGRYYAAGQLRENKATSAKAAIDDTLNYLVENTFPKLGMLTYTSKNPQTEIKAVLAAPPTDGLRLEGGDANPEALKEVAGYVDLMNARNHQVVLYDLIENRFGRRPFGWNDWEVLLLVVRLVMAGEISLVLDGATLSSDRIYNAIEGTNKWRRVTVVKRKTVDKGNIQAARNIAKDVFGTLAPDGEDALSTFIMKGFEGWLSDLQRWKPLADTGSYPGGSDIANALGVVNKTLTIVNTYEFIGHFIERKDDLLELTETMAELRNFYNSQRPAWDTLRAAHGIFQSNRYELDKNADAASGLGRIEEILNASAPYDMIKEAEGLIEKVGKVNDGLVKLRRKQAVEHIDERIDAVKEALEALGNADPELSNACLHPLQAIRKRVEGQDSLAHVEAAQGEAGDAQYDALDRIDAEKARRKAEADGKTQGANDHGQSGYAHEPRETVVLKPANLTTKHWLESEEDVDAFLERLREELLKNLKDNKRVRIQ